MQLPWALGVVALVVLWPSMLAAAAPAPAVATGGPPPVPVLNGVWCAGPSQCLAVGGDARHQPISEIWNGRAWKYLPTPAQGQVLSALSCASWTNCMAVGGFGVIDQWNGASWRVLTTPPSAALQGVSCPARRFCAAVGKTSYTGGVTGALVWRGRSWLATPVPKPTGAASSSLVSVSCPSATNCLAVGLSERPHAFMGTPMAASWNGSRWTLIAAPPVPVYAVSCPGPDDCLATGNDRAALWDGSAWHKQTAIPKVGPVISISCAGPSFCLAVNGSAVLEWNGSSWSAEPGPVPDGLRSVWCASSADCMGVGGGPAGSTSAQWNGASWTTWRTSPLDGLGAVSCPASTWCVALGSYVSRHDDVAALAEYWNGRSWRAGPAPAAPVQSVSCTSPASCMAITGSAAYRWDGQRWKPTLTGASNLLSVSCAGRTCLAVGYGTAWAWNGAAWHSVNPSANGQAVNLLSVSCASGQMCMTIGFAFNRGCSNCNQCGNNCSEYSYAERWNGARFVLTFSAVGPGLGTGVSCPTARLCVAVSGTRAMAWTGHAWRNQVVPAPGGLNAVSCAGPSSCLAVGSAAVAWHGKAWRPLHLAPPAGRSGLASVSCARSGRCVAAGQADGQVVAELWNGSRWTLLDAVNL